MITFLSIIMYNTKKFYTIKQVFDVSEESVSVSEISLKLSSLVVQWQLNFSRVVPMTVSSERSERVTRHLTLL